MTIRKESKETLSAMVDAAEETIPKAYARIQMLEDKIKQLESELATWRKAHNTVVDIMASKLNDSSYNY